MSWRWPAPPSGVDVLLARDTLAYLQPPPTSIVDSRPSPHVVTVCCLRAAGVSRFTVRLRVDEATARRFARACRLETMWQRRTVPAVLALAGLGLGPAVAGAVSRNLALVLLSGLVQLGIALATIIGRTALNLQRSRHHPVLAGRDRVLVRGVDRATARAWADLNAAGAIQVRDR